MFYPSSMHTSYMVRPSKHQTIKFTKTPLTHDVAKEIVQFFAFNNFQDFNAWQQIARSSINVNYTQQPYRCHVVLFFDDRGQQLPVFSVTGEGKSKKEAKKKAFQRLIIDIAEKGYIGLGFKQQDYMDKIQKKRRQHILLRDEPIEDEEDRQKRYDTLYKLINDQKSIEAIQFLCKDAFSSKPLEIRQVISSFILSQVSLVWVHLLLKQDIKLIEFFLRRLHNDNSLSHSFEIDSVIQSSNLQGKKSQILFEQYGFNRSKVDNLFQKFDEHNLSFFQKVSHQVMNYQSISIRNPFEYEIEEIFTLWKPSKDFEFKSMYHGIGNSFNQKVIKKRRNLQSIADPLPMPLITKGYKDSQIIIPEGVDLVNIKPGEKFPLFPPPLLPLIGIHPLLAVESFKSKLSMFQNNKPFLFSPASLNYRIPIFQSRMESHISSQVKYLITPKCLQMLYDGLFYFSDHRYSLKIAQLIYSLCKVNLGNKLQTDYYLNRKNQLVCQFIQTLHIYSQSSTFQQATCIQGIAIQVFNKNKQQVIHFTPKEVYLENKLSKKNLNQFQEQKQITKGQYILVRYDSHSYIGFLKEANPIIIVCPWIKIQEHFSCKIQKITNRKIYDRMSQSLIDFSLNNMSLLSGGHIQLFWQLPGTSRSFLIETVLDWSKQQQQIERQKDLNKQHNVLIVSLDINQVSEDLQRFGIKHIKVSSKIDEKLLLSTSSPRIIVSSITSCNIDVLKGLKFTHVLIDEANRISQVLSLMPISRGCRQLVMVGDFSKPPPLVLSKLATSKGMAISLFQRLSDQGVPVLCYNSQRKMHKSICDYVSEKFYQSILKTSQQSIRMLPKVKGFKWPDEQNRLCIVNVKGEYQNRINVKEAEIVIKIVTDVLKAGFTELKDISVIVPTEQQRQLVIQLLSKILNILTLSNGASKSSQQKPPHLSTIINNFHVPSEYSQRDLVIVSCCGSGNETGLNDQRKLNFSMSRATKGIIVVGNIELLLPCEHFLQLVKEGNKKNLIYNI